MRKFRLQENKYLSQLAKLSFGVINTFFVFRSSYFINTDVKNVLRNSAEKHKKGSTKVYHHTCKEWISVQTSSGEKWTTQGHPPSMIGPDSSVEESKTWQPWPSMGVWGVFPLQTQCSPSPLFFQEIEPCDDTHGDISSAAFPSPIICGFSPYKPHHSQQNTALSIGWHLVCVCYVPSSLHGLLHPILLRIYSYCVHFADGETEGMDGWMMVKVEIQTQS